MRTSLNRRLGGHSSAGEIVTTAAASSGARPSSLLSAESLVRQPAENLPKSRADAADAIANVRTITPAKLPSVAQAGVLECPIIDCMEQILNDSASQSSIYFRMRLRAARVP